MQVWKVGSRAVQFRSIHHRREVKTGIRNSRLIGACPTELKLRIQGTLSGLLFRYRSSRARVPWGRLKARGPATRPTPRRGPLNETLNYLSNCVCFLTFSLNFAECGSGINRQHRHFA